MASKRLTGAFFGCVARKGVTDAIFVSGKEGKIAAIIYPDSENTEVIQSVWAGKRLNIREKDISSPNLNWDIDEARSSNTGLPAYEVIAKETTRQNCGYSLRPNPGILLLMVASYRSCYERPIKRICFAPYFTGI